jgi:hypothetical protein
MKITLEVEDVRFATTTEGSMGSIRWLIVKIADKHFHVRRELNDYGWERERYRNEIDHMLVETMQLMLETVFLKSAASLPNGVIETKCPSGELWRFHYAAKCGCEKPVRVPG